jgi:hypothetical protein
MPQLHVKVADTAPDEPALTAYDKEHAVTYARLLDAEADNADWREVARIVLHIDPTSEPERARVAFESHLARAKWMARHGYRHLLRDGWPESETWPHCEEIITPPWSPAAETTKPFGERILLNQKWPHLSCCNCASFLITRSGKMLSWRMWIGDPRKLTQTSRMLNRWT